MSIGKCSKCGSPLFWKWVDLGPQPEEMRKKTTHGMAGGIILARRSGSYDAVCRQCNKTALTDVIIESTSGIIDYPAMGVK